MMRNGFEKYWKSTNILAKKTQKSYCNFLLTNGSYDFDFIFVKSRSYSSSMAKKLFKKRFGGLS